MQKIEIIALAKRFGRTLLFRGINAVFTPGVHGIAGPNGSGKSTLLKCVSGLQKPTSGEINYFDGTRILTQAERLLHTAYSAPYIHLYPELTVQENLEFICRLLGKSNEFLDIIIGKTGIEDIRLQPYGSLSSGQQQRSRLASALIKDCDILFLDEPGTNLDLQGYAMIESLIAEYKKKDKIVLLASNQSREIDLCDTVLDLNNFKPERRKQI